MKIRQLADAAIVAAMLLCSMPEMEDDLMQISPEALLGGTPTGCFAGSPGGAAPSCHPGSGLGGGGTDEVL